MSAPTLTAQNNYQGHEDPFYCKCVFCRKFWSSTFGSLEHFANTAPLERSIATSSLFRQKGIIKVGDRVVVDGEHKGVVKFVGLLQEDQLAPKTWVGVKLDDNINATNGTFNNKSYFHCPNGHGVLVPYSAVRECAMIDKRPPLTGNEMFPSYDTVRANRRIRLALEEELNSIKNSGKIPAMFKSGSAAAISDDNSSPDHQKTISSRPATSLSNRTGQASFVFTSNKKFRMKNEQKRLEQLKNEFGGGERGDTLLRTFQKLQLAYDRGREYLASQQSALTTSNTSASTTST